MIPINISIFKIMKVLYHIQRLRHTSFKEKEIQYNI